MNGGPWWIDYGTGELVRTADGKRWRVEDVALLQGPGVVDIDKVDQWVMMQPRDDA